MKNTTSELATLREHPVPALDVLSRRHSTASGAAQRASLVKTLRSLQTNSPFRADGTLDTGLLQHALLVSQLNRDCHGTLAAGLWLDSIETLMKAAARVMTPPETDALWRSFRASSCYRELMPIQRDVFALFGAVGRRDAGRMAVLSEKLLRVGELPSERNKYLLSIGMLGYLADDKPNEALKLWHSHARRALGSQPPDIMLRLLLAHSVVRSRPRGS